MWHHVTRLARERPRVLLSLLAATMMIIPVAFAVIVVIGNVLLNTVDTAPPQFVSAVVRAEFRIVVSDVYFWGGALFIVGGVVLGVYARTCGAGRPGPAKCPNPVRDSK
jgi:hypothetical protein